MIRAPIRPRGEYSETIICELAFLHDCFLLILITTSEYNYPVLSAVTPRGSSPLVELPLPRQPVGIADSRLQHRSSNAFLTAIKSASFPMALLHDFLDRINFGESVCSISYFLPKRAANLTPPSRLALLQHHRHQAALHATSIPRLSSVDATLTNAQRELGNCETV